MTQFITLKTFSPTPYHAEQHNVTIATQMNFASGKYETLLLGNLEHCTQLIIDQELVDQLQGLVDFYKNQ